MLPLSHPEFKFYSHWPKLSNNLILSIRSRATLSRLFPCVPFHPPCLQIWLPPIHCHLISLVSSFFIASWVSKRSDYGFLVVVMSWVSSGSNQDTCSGCSELWSKPQRPKDPLSHRYCLCLIELTKEMKIGP